MRGETTVGRASWVNDSAGIRLRGQETVPLNVTLSCPTTTQSKRAALTSTLRSVYHFPCNLKTRAMTIHEPLLHTEELEYE